ncbi:hypothetical protein ILYODFUR_004470 [Ilyodon furcidens]|uniref:Uncharacterized protein n=1 Tax=Ilyodon furcidens TaxID=33524 RepID=A0ABV0SIH1_9TELE
MKVVASETMKIAVFICRGGEIKSKQVAAKTVERTKTQKSAEVSECGFYRSISTHTALFLFLFRLSWLSQMEAVSVTTLIKNGETQQPAQQQRRRQKQAKTKRKNVCLCNSLSVQKAVPPSSLQFTGTGFVTFV